MRLQTRTFQDMVDASTAAVQGSAAGLVDMTQGSVLRALVEADASVALWMQWLVMQVLDVTRAQTSSGPDLDSWVSDFTLSRLPAVPASGRVMFGRFVAASGATIPVGTIVRTGDGAQSYAVYADSANVALSADRTGYVVATGVPSIDLPVSAVTAGVAGNVQAGAISLIAAALPGVDTVTNPAAIFGGLDAESDDALRARFRGFLAGLARATPVALRTAISGVRQGLSFVVSENVAADGSVRAGNFVVTLDDGSGAPTRQTMDAVVAAVEAVRPLGSTFQVIAPVVTYAHVSLVIDTASGTDHAAATAAVMAGVSAGINSLPIGGVLAWSRIAQWAYDASPAVVNVRSVLLNGGDLDVVPPGSGVVRAAPVLVS